MEFEEGDTCSIVLDRVVGYIHKFVRDSYTRKNTKCLPANIAIVRDIFQYDNGTVDDAACYLLGKSFEAWRGGLKTALESVNIRFTQAGERRKVEVQKNSVVSIELKREWYDRIKEYDLKLFRKAHPVTHIPDEMARGGEGGRIAAAEAAAALGAAVPALGAAVPAQAEEFLAQAEAVRAEVDVGDVLPSLIEEMSPDDETSPVQSPSLQSPSPPSTSPALHPTAELATTTPSCTNERKTGDSSAQFGERKRRLDEMGLQSCANFAKKVTPGVVEALMEKVHPRHRHEKLPPALVKAVYTELMNICDQRPKEALADKVDEVKKKASRDVYQQLVQAYRTSILEKTDEATTRILSLLVGDFTRSEANDNLLLVSDTKITRHMWRKALLLRKSGQSVFEADNIVFGPKRDVVRMYNELDY